MDASVSVQGNLAGIAGRFRCPLGGLWTLSARRGRYNRGLGSSESHADRRAGRGACVCGVNFVRDEPGQKGENGTLDRQCGLSPADDCGSDRCADADRSGVLSGDQSTLPSLYLVPVGGDLSGKGICPSRPAVFASLSGNDGFGGCCVLPNIPAGGCLCAASPGTFAGGTGPLESGHLFAVLDGFVQPGFFRRLRQYDDFPAGVVQPLAVAVPLWRALDGVPSVRSKPRQGYFWLHGLLWAKALLAAAGALSSGKRSWLVFPPTLPGPCSACLFGYRKCNRGRDGLFQHGGDGRTYGGHS